MSSSTVTYTSVYSDSDPWRFQCVSDDEPQSPEAASQLPEQAPPYLDYVPGPEHPPYPDYVPDPEYPKYVAPFDDEVLAKDQPLPVDASPTALSPGYITDSDPEEDPKEDHVDYPADEGDDDEEEEEEPSEDDADDDEEETSEDEEEEHPAPAESAPPRSPYERLARFMAAPALPSPPPSLRRYSRGGYAASKESPFTAHTSMYEIGESSSAATARQTRRTLARSVDYGFIDTVDASIRASESRAITADDRSLLRAQVSLLTRDIRYFRSMAYSYESEPAEARRAWTESESRRQTMEAQMRALQRDHEHDKFRELVRTRDTGPQDGPTDVGVANALAEYEANRGSGNSDDSHDFKIGGRRQVKGTDMLSYKQRFQELALMCERMFPEESDEVEKYVGGLSDMIQGSVMASKPKTMQDAIEIATKHMDQKIRTFADRQAENKRKLDDTSRNNQNQQQPFKRHNVARAYTAGPGEKKVYGGSKPLFPKCNYHHDGQCAPKYTNCKRDGHLACDCRSPAVAANNQRASGAIQRVLTYFECGAQGHYKRDFPKLKNKNQGNQARNGNAQARAYVVGTAWTNQNSNVVTSTFLLNNRYPLILFDIGADRSFVSAAFSSLIDIISTTLDHDYDVELADENNN
ncbi:hypothetical protein Tco_0488701 [Tanacetum coccineum]